MELHLMNKYHLKDLHKEIDYFDRKVAYCETHEQFESDVVRAVAVRKLLTRRERLVKVAVELARRGIEYNAEDLPRSFKSLESGTSESSPS